MLNSASGEHGDVNTKSFLARDLLDNGAGVSMKRNIFCVFLPFFFFLENGRDSHSNLRFVLCQG